MAFGPFKFATKDKQNGDLALEYAQREFVNHLAPGWRCNLFLQQEATIKFTTHNVYGTFEWDGEGEKTEEDARSEFKRIQAIYTQAVIGRFLESMANGHSALTSSLAARTERDPDSVLHSATARSSPMRSHV